MSPSRPSPAIRGLYAITPDELAFPELRSRLSAALQGGARVVQYRRKQRAEDVALREATELLGLCRQHGAIFLVNDSPALAARIGADGVHVGREDGSPEGARAIVGVGSIVGVSAYNDFARARSLSQQGADYVAFGSFHPSTVKPNAVRASPDLLVRAKAEGLGCPVVAIGGITVDNAPDLIEAGADAIAVISALFDAPDVGRRAEAFARLFGA